MKKITSLFLILCLALPLSAQIGRHGNTYMADGQVMKDKDFAAYMQANAEQNLAKQFQSGKTVSNVGWGLFGGGLGLNVAGWITANASVVKAAKEDNVGSAFGTALGGTYVGSILIWTGAAITTAGIVCLGVGYGRMHKTADLWAIQQNASRKSEPQAYLSIQANVNGLGLALNF